MKREREKHITRLHIILFLLVVIAGLTIFFVVKNNKQKEMLSYKNLEKDLVSATRDYYKINPITIKEGYDVVVEMKTLVEQNFISNELTSKCDGYTKIENAKSLDGDYELEYTAYIKCGDKYTSDYYSSSR